MDDHKREDLRSLPPAHQGETGPVMGPPDDARVPPCGAAKREMRDTKRQGQDRTRGSVNPDQAPASLPGVPGYEILDELGRGSMGVVYKARQLALDRLVALKMIPGGGDADGEKRQRFLTEARVVASLQHPNIVQLYEINFEQDTPYFAMELVEGGTLADQLGGRPQPFPHAAQTILTLARAIHVAHQQGIVHRDLKPANILIVAPSSSKSHHQEMAREMGLLSPDLSLGTPKITDFGLAKRLHDDASQTESGMIMGTPSYMAPEQAEGQSREVGPTADIYALGAILYEMLTGRPPFTAESPLETVLLLFQTEPVPPSHLQPRTPRDLETICLKCLQKTAQQRYASALELAEDLHRFLAGEPIQARPASLIEKLRKWRRRRPALATLVGCSALTVGCLLGLALWHQVHLQIRLGQALGAEREARTAEEVAGEQKRLAQLRGRLKDLLHAGDAALTAQEWNNARLQLTRARDQANDEPELADLRARIKRLLGQIDQQRRDHERLQKFRQCHNDALFHATLFTGGDLASALQDTRTATLEALALFGVTPDSTGGPVVDSPYYGKQQQAEITASCYELLVLLADATVRPLPGSPANQRAAEKALRILDRAGHLGVTTQAYHRRRAHFLALAGQSQAAAQERQRANAIRPATALDHFLLGQERYRQGDSKQARLAFENVLQVQPTHFWASYYLALCWLKTQQPHQAAACLTACLGQRRDLPWLYILRASAWGELGEFGRAEADFAAALAAPLSDGARYGLLINRAVLRIRQGRLDSARIDLQQAVVLRPKQYQAYVNLAQAHLKGQNLPAAIEQLERAIRREPRLASLYRTRARLYLLKGDQSAALKDLDQTIRLQAGAATPALVEDHLERGRLLHRQKDYSRALQAYDAALRIRPRDARGCRLRAECLLELNRLPEALKSLDDCLKYGPPDVGAFRARASLRTRLGHHAGAQSDCTRVLEMAPDAAAYADRGWCYLVANAPRVALPDFEEAIRLAPEKGDAYAGRGYSHVLLGEVRLAVADAEEGKRRGPASPRLDYNLARIYARAAAQNSDPRSRSRSSHWQHCALQLLARSLEKQSSSDAARFWQNVVQSDPAMHSVRRSPTFGQLASRYGRPRPATPPR